MNTPNLEKWKMWKIYRDKASMTVAAQTPAIVKAFVASSFPDGDDADKSYADARGASAEVWAHTSEPGDVLVFEWGEVVNLSGEVTMIEDVRG